MELRGQRLRRRYSACLAAALVWATVPMAAGGQQTTPAEGFERIHITAGRSTVLTTDFEIARIAVTNPLIADATVVQPREILIDGKAPGTISLIVWGAGRRAQYDLVIAPGVTNLQ